jgi:hypothetical protein
MAVYKTLANLKNKVDNESKGGGGKKFLTLKDRDAFKIRFLQELTIDSKNFNESRGAAAIVAVHKSPLDFKKQMACTADNEEMGFKCWACEQTVKDPKWRPQTHFVVNVAVLDENKNWSTMILDQTFNQRHIGATLVEYATEFGTITDRSYKVSRSGSKMHDTNYTLIPIETGDEPTEFADLEMHDVLSVYRVMPYNEQSDFMTSTEEPARNGASGW